MDCFHNDVIRWLRRPVVLWGSLGAAVFGALLLNWALFSTQPQHQPAAVVNNPGAQPGEQTVESLSSSNQGTQDVAGSLMFGDDMVTPCPTLRKLNRLKHAQED